MSTHTTTTTTVLPTAGNDALALLRADHQLVGSLLDDLLRLLDGDLPGHTDAGALVARLAVQLRAHAQAEEEIFYPALPAPADARQSAAEHDDVLQRLEDLARLARHAPAVPVAQLRQPAQALAAAVRAHVAHEETELFPLATGLDLETMGSALAARRAALVGEQGPD